jgi:hypothetical protein
MKIQMLHGIVFREGKVNTAYSAGDIIDVSEAEAKQLIAEGSAIAEEETPVAEPKPKKTTKVI